MTSIRERHGGWFLSPSLLALKARSLASSASSFWCGPAGRSAHWAGATWQRSSTTSLLLTSPEASSSTRLYACKQLTSYITLSHSYYCYVGESTDMIHLSRSWKLIGMRRENPVFHLAQNVGPCKSGSVSIYSRIAQFKALAEERMRARVSVFKTSESLLMFESCTLRVNGGY